MRKFLFIFGIFSILFTAGCSEKTDTNKTAQKQTAETKTEIADTPKIDYSNLTQEQLNIEIIKVCKQGKLPELRALIKQGADINVPVWEIDGKYHFQIPIPTGPVRAGTTTPTSETPLISAVSAGHLALVKELIKAGADVNKGNSHKETPLMFAAINGNIELIELLLSAGADVNAKSASYSSATGPRSYTALYFASESGHLQAVETLLSAGAKTDIPNTEHPLAGASERGHLEIVKLLQASGAQIQTITTGPGCQSSNPLVKAVRGGNVEVVKALIDGGASVNALGCDNTSPLKWAIFIKNAEIVKVLVNAGAKVNKSDTDGVTGRKCSPLELAKEIGDKEIIDILKKAAPKADTQKEIDLIRASESGNIKKVKELIVADIDINQKLISANLLASANGCEPPSLYSMTGETPLQRAAENGHLEIVKMLLAAGAKTDIQNSFGETALMLASKRGYTDIVKALLKAGADFNIKNKCGGTAETMARRMEQTDVRNILIRAAQLQIPAPVDEVTAANKPPDIIQVLPYNPNLREDRAIVVAASKNQLERVKALLADNVDADSTISNGTTALMYASGRGYIEIIKTLLEANAFVDKTNNYGHTALIYASTYGQTAAMKELIKAGADVNAADRPGRMSLRFAVEKGQKEAVKILLEAGADVRGIKKTYAGKTALQIAQQNGNEDIVKLLKSAGAK